MTDIERRIEAAMIEWFRSAGAEVLSDIGEAKIQVVSGSWNEDDDTEEGDVQTICVDLSALARHIDDELERRK